MKTIQVVIVTVGIVVIIIVMVVAVIPVFIVVVTMVVVVTKTQNVHTQKIKQKKHEIEHLQNTQSPMHDETSIILQTNRVVLITFSCEALMQCYMYMYQD